MKRIIDFRSERLLETIWNFNPLPLQMKEIKLNCPRSLSWKYIRNLYQFSPQKHSHLATLVLDYSFLNIKRSRTRLWLQMTRMALLLNVSRVRMILCSCSIAFIRTSLLSYVHIPIMKRQSTWSQKVLITLFMGTPT